MGGKGRRWTGWIGVSLAATLACDASGSADASADTGSSMPACGPEELDGLYAKRIAPLLAEDRPSSCNECHLSGIDLGSFVRDSPCQTMACMTEQGLVDLQAPEQSLILDWIARADPASELVTQETIDQEYEGMLEWIEYSASCGAQACEPIENPCGEAPTWEDCEVPVAAHGQESMPWDDPGDCSEPTLEAMFAAKVYAWRGRCFPCHFADSDFDAPSWIQVGACELGSLHTMRDVLERGLVNLDDPTRSELLLRPLAVQSGGVEHGGGDKFQSDQEGAYLDFLAWIQRYAQCQQD